LFVLILGVAPLLWSGRAFALDPRRAAAVALLTLIGMCLSGTGILRRALDVRWPVRAVALLAAGATSAATLVLRYRMLSDVLPALQNHDVELRPKAAMAAASLLWIAVGLAYVGVSIALLPGCRGARAEDTKRDEPTP